MCYNLTGVVYHPPWVINTVFGFRRRGMRLLRTPWVELRRERDGARVMETVVSYPGVKNCTAQRAMYIERPRVAEKRAYLALKRGMPARWAAARMAGASSAVQSRLPAVGLSKNR